MIKRLRDLNFDLTVIMHKIEIINGSSLFSKQQDNYSSWQYIKVMLTMCLGVSSKKDNSSCVKSSAAYILTT